MKLYIFLKIYLTAQHKHIVSKEEEAQIKRTLYVDGSFVL